MKNEPLKIRANRLRTAIKQVLGREISMSQSLELVAKEENYDNWDQACALFQKKNPPSLSAIDPVYSTLRFNRRSMDYKKTDLKQLFNGNEETLRSVQRLLEDDQHGALVVICGITSSGKSNTMNTLTKSFLQNKNCPGSTGLFHAGVIETEFPKDVNISTSKNLTAQQASLGLKQPCVVINQVSDKETAYAAVMLASKGHKVLFTHHSKGCAETIANLSKMLSDVPHAEGVMADSLLAELVMNGLVRVIYQQLDNEEVINLMVTPKMTELDIMRRLEVCLRMCPDVLKIVFHSETTVALINYCKGVAEDMELKGIKVELKFDFNLEDNFDCDI